MVTKGTYTSDLSTDEKVLMAVIRAAEHFKRVHSGVFRNFGLSFPQYNVLRVLDASKNGQNNDVSRIMLVPGANITGIAKRLEKDGFIKKKSIPEDDRVTLLEITPKGKKTLQKIEEEKNQRLELMMKDLAKKEKAALLDMVKRILKNGMLLKKSL